MGKLPHFAGRAALDDINSRASAELDAAIAAGDPGAASNTLIALLMKVEDWSDEQAKIWIEMLERWRTLSQMEAAEALRLWSPALKALAAELAAYAKGKIAGVSREYGKGLERAEL